jgi:hypothetical protein
VWDTGRRAVSRRAKLILLAWIARIVTFSISECTLAHAYAVRGVRPGMQVSECEGYSAGEGRGSAGEREGREGLSKVLSLFQTVRPGFRARSASAGLEEWIHRVAVGARGEEAVGPVLCSVHSAAPGPVPAALSAVPTCLFVLCPARPGRGRVLEGSTGHCPRCSGQYRVLPRPALNSIACRQSRRAVRCR